LLVLLANKSEVKFASTNLIVYWQQ